MNSVLIQELVKNQLKNIPEIKAGAHVRVHEKIKEKNRERIQIFEGFVIAKKHGKGINATFTARKIIDGIGVEKTWPIHSPLIEKIEIIKTPKIGRAKLYFLRRLSPTKIRKKLSVFKTILPESTLILENEKKDSQETIIEEKTETNS